MRIKVRVVESTELNDEELATDSSNLREATAIQAVPVMPRVVVSTATTPRQRKRKIGDVSKIA